MLEVALALLTGNVGAKLRGYARLAAFAALALTLALIALAALAFALFLWLEMELGALRAALVVAAGAGVLALIASIPLWLKPKPPPPTAAATLVELAVSIGLALLAQRKPRKLKRVGSISLDILQPRSAPGAKTFPRLLNAPQEPRIVFKPILEPIVLRFEANKQSRRLTVTGNDNFLAFRFAKIARQIILDFRERNFLHSGLANCASHDTASLLVTIAKT